MIKTLFAALLCLAPALVFAQDDNLQQLKDIRKEFRKINSKFAESIEEAETEDEKAKLEKEKSEAHAKLAEKAVSLSRVLDEERLEIKMLAYLTRMGKGEARDIAAKTLAIDHIESRFMGEWVESIAQFRTPFPHVEKWLRFIQSKSPVKKVRGMATYALLRHMQKLAGSSKQRSAIAKAIGEEGPDYLASRPKQKCDEAVEWLAKTIIDEYPSAKIGDARAIKMAKSIMVAKRLAIGKIVPEIEGKDLDGVTFRLSDYRGKVVVLDFWGDW